MAGNGIQTEEPTVPDLVKKVLIWMFWIFLVYSIFTAPDRAADIVRTAWSILVSGAENLSAFFTQLLRR